jgi:pimeloyl-ACP methyl ester carboxylesterase
LRFDFYSANNFSILDLQHTPREGFINYKGNSIKYLHQVYDPQRPTLIFLHDSLGCIQLWRNFPEQVALLTGYNFFVYDRIGYGQSSAMTHLPRSVHYLEEEADILAQIITQQNLTPAILWGHSDGGSIALIAAAKYPQLVQAIITEGAHVFIEDITLQGIRQAEADYQNTDLKQRLEKYHHNNTNALFHAWVDTWQYPEFEHWNIEHFLAQIHCPTLVIQGEWDEFGSEAQVDSIVQQVAGYTEKRMIPQAGHSPHKKSIFQLAEITAEFLKKI